MKKILFLSPVPRESESSGISIRIQELKSQLEKQGISGKIIDKYKDEDADFFYVMVSTYANSMSSQAVKLFPSNKKIIVDLYTPILLEKDLSFNILNPRHWYVHFQKRRAVKKIIQRGNQFLVANHRQKKYWLRTVHELKVKTQSQDISVIPTGAPLLPLSAGEVDNSNGGPTVILWFGGIYPWMNPTPLVEVFAKVAPQNPKWKLRILGGFHPKTGYFKIYKDVIGLARKKIKRNQLEIIPWQNEGQLTNYLKDVSFAVHLVKKTEEDYYAHRVRLLTLTQAGIPVLTNGKDIISDLIVKQQAGEKVGTDNTDFVFQLTSLLASKNRIKAWSKNCAKVQGLFEKQQRDIHSLQKFLAKT